MSEIDDFERLPDQAFVRLPVMIALLGCSSSTVWRMVKRGEIPRPYKISERVTAWNAGEVRQKLNTFKNGELK